MAKFPCEIKKLLVLGADPSFLLKNVYYTITSQSYVIIVLILQI